MSDTTPKTPVIDYWAIFNELKKGIELSKPLLASTNFKPAAAIREISTIGFTAPRQTGKTSWLIEFMVRYPNTPIVVPNLTWRDYLTEARDLHTLEYKVPRELLGNIFTAYELGSAYVMSEAQLEVWKNAEYVLVDEANRTYDYLSRRYVSEFISTHSNQPTVIEVG